MQPVDTAPLVNSAANSLNVISNEGLLGAVTVLAVFFAAIAAYILIRQARACFEGTKTALDNNTEMIRDFKDSNKEALHGVQLAIARLDSKLDK